MLSNNLIIEIMIIVCLSFDVFLNDEFDQSRYRVPFMYTVAKFEVESVFCCYDGEVFRFRTLNMRQNDYILVTIFLFIFSNENSCILIQISLKLLGPFDYVRIGSDNNLTPKRRRSLFEPMMVLFSDAYIRHSASVCWARLITSYSNYENNAMHCQHKSTSNKVLRRIRLTIRQYWYA